MTISKLWPSVFIGLLLLCAIPASASPVTFFFAGHVNSEAINGCGVLVNCGVVTGTYTFDSTTPDLNPDPTLGLYVTTNITFSIDGVPFFSSASGFINVANFSLVDQYGVLATGTASNLSTATLSILLSDPTATAFSSDALPQNPAALASMLPGTFQLNADDSTFQLLGSIDSIVAPAPGAGLLQVCKVASGGVAVGTPFTFSVGGAPVIVPAGPGPGGACSGLLPEPAGTVGITETIPAGVVVTAITTSPAAALVSSNLPAGTATVTVTAGGLTIVTFTDALFVNTAFVQICKVAGTGVAVGTPFAFSVAGAPVTLPAGPAPGGSCSAPLVEPAGPVIITETLPPLIALISVTTVPPGALVSSNLAAGTATVTATNGVITIVTFTDALALDIYQIRYAANLDKGDSYVNLTNAGTLSGADPAGRICVNVYTFDPAEEMISCCSCPVTPNGLNSLSVRNDLISNTLTAGTPTSVVIKLLASVPVAGTCNAGSPTTTNLVRGMRAWGTTLHALPTTPVTYGKAETPFSPVELSVTELAKLTTFCQFIQSNGSGFGICKSCQTGGLGAVSK